MVMTQQLHGFQDRRIGDLVLVWPHPRLVGQPHHSESTKVRIMLTDHHDEEHQNLRIHHHLGLSALG